MKPLRIFILLTSMLALSLHGQEVILEPSFLKTKPSKQRKTSALNLVYIEDTLTLPFIDDFSTNLLKPATSSSAIDSNYTLQKQWKYYLLGESIPLNTNGLSFDTSFTTTMTASDTTIIASNPADTLLLVDYSIYPATILDSLPVWNNYSLVDSFNTASFDTLFVDTITNDSAEFALVAPYKNLWLDNLVNINSNYPIEMPSIGVATMDAVDHYGYVYGQGSTATFSADSLTSKSINLSGQTAVYLSFMVQPGGIGDEPESQDKLILQFKDSAGIWNEVWSSVDESNLETTSFKSIYNAVDDQKYLHETFQFMFVNFASLSDVDKGWQSNADQWHLDYVILDSGRSNNDDYIKDVCFSTVPTTLINSYYNVPWTHYKSNTTLTASNSIAEVYNNSSSVVNNNYQSEISTSGAVVFSDGAAGSASLSAAEKKNFSQALSGFAFSSSESYAADFDVSHSLSSDLSGDIIKANDTVRMVQQFGQHYAYDDGTAEAGYGLNSFEGRFALKYDLLSTSEQLTAIDIYFNNTLTQENFNVPFQLVVWSDNNGAPGDILSETISRFPLVSDSLNTFLSYKLPSPINVSGTIYVGWKQLSAGLLNIGLDRNTDSKSRMFYNVNDSWRNSSIEGTVMIRPRFGDYSFLSAAEIRENTLVVYPNPAQNIVHIENLPSGVLVEIFDAFGQEVMRSSISPINITALTAGAYFIQVQYPTGDIKSAAKFIKL